MKKLISSTFLCFVLTLTGCEPAKEEVDPNATITVSAVAGYRAPAIVNFSTPDETPGAVYAWDFGDGTTSSDKNPSKTYTTGGGRNVKLTITANGKVKDSITPVNIEAPYTKVTITAVKVLENLQSYPNGTGWDVASTGTIYQTGGADMYVLGRLDGNAYSEFYSSIKTNVTPAQVSGGTINWVTPYTPGGLFQRTFSGADLGKNLYVALRDSDDGSINYNSTYENMGEVVIKLSDFMTTSEKYPTSITRQGSGGTASNALKLQMALKWE
jgi:hypothetical protein